MIHATTRGGVYFVLAILVAGCAAGEAVRAPSSPGQPASPISVRIVRPDGAGPFPAVVWLHGCGGVVRGARHVDDWTRRLVRLGYVVAIPDSFSERGYPNGVCGNGGLVPALTRAGDAYTALRLLEARPDVVPERIGAIGFSHGGWTVLAALDQDVAARARAGAGAEHGFAAAIAYYPECSAGSWIPTYHTAAPLLILIGERDDWTPALPCERLAQRTRAQGQPVSLLVYPGAYHSFDSYAPVTLVPEARQGRGATIGGDARAREDSIKQVETFFGRYLR